MVPPWPIRGGPFFPRSLRCGSFWSTGSDFFLLDQNSTFFQRGVVYIEVSWKNDTSRRNGEKNVFSPFCPRERFFGVVSHLTRDLCLFIKLLCFFFIRVVYMEVNLEWPWKQNRSELFSSRGKSQKACFSVDIDSRDRSLFFKLDCSSNFSHLF